MSDYPVTISDARTRGVRVQVKARYSPDHSSPREHQWFFLYTIRISNEGDAAVQLLNRHWVITTATGEVEEVRGPGVVGAQPKLDPGESFEYTSGCPLSTPYGSMKGEFEMRSIASEEPGDTFEAEVAPFVLTQPSAVH